MVIGLIRIYQLLLGPFLGGACRFYPSCSEFAVSAVRRDGAWQGGRVALRRLTRCHPLGPGGLDLP